jgi:hypothetical protein
LAFGACLLTFDFSYTHWVGDTIELRPELRFERALDAEPTTIRQIRSMAARRIS